MTALQKLFTKEDPVHIHKTLGIVSLLHFFYRFYLLFYHGSMFLNSHLDVGMVSLHGCLSVSSLAFHIPKKRHSTLPMIYPEFRLHSILFGLRSVVCCIIE